MADRVRLSLFCPTCLPGYHLPFFSGVSSGIFAEHGLVVDILDPPPPPGTSNTHRVASGGAEFGLTGITYFLMAQREAGPGMAARFVSVIHQRSPLGAIVAEDSDIRSADDLPGRRVGKGELTGWLADECSQALADRGLGAPRVVPLGHGDAPYALGRGEIDIVATLVDTLGGIGAKGGLAVRAIHLGGDLYASGLVASDGVPLEVVERMRAAVVASFELQRRQPDSAVAEYCQRFPDVAPDIARAGWERLLPYAVTGRGFGAMDALRWSTTASWLQGVHGLPPVPEERIYRPELLSRSSDAASSGSRTRR